MIWTKWGIVVNNNWTRDSFGNTKNSRAVAIAIKGRSIVLRWVKYSSGYSRSSKMSSPNKLPIARTGRKIRSNLADAREMSRNGEWMFRFIVSKTRMCRINASVNKPNGDSFSSSFKPTCLRPSSLWQTQKLWSVCGCSPHRKIQNHIGHFSSPWQFFCLQYFENQELVGWRSLSKQTQTPNYAQMETTQTMKHVFLHRIRT